MPTTFAFIACSYALSTIADSWAIILPVALIWSFIILVIDRALLATYRSYQGLHRKVSQFFLRFVVAILMGVTISHPLTLLLFKDTIESSIEEERAAEIEVVRKKAEVDKAAVEAKIVLVEEDLAARRADWKESLKSDFLLAEEDGDGPRAALPTDGLDEASKAELQKQIDHATAPNAERVAAIDTEIETVSGSFNKVQGEQDFWQREFEREVNGQRSGIVGLGPRARSIRDDQLAPRRAESKRLSDQLEHLTRERNGLRELIATTEKKVTEEFLAAQVAIAQELEEKREFAEQLERKVKEAQTDSFVVQQNEVAKTIMDQINLRNEELERLQAEVAQVDTDKDAHVLAIQEEPRRDILTQTLALHGLFLSGEEGGEFALTAYLILAALFMLIDTIPIVVKFFSKPGPYDTLVDCEESRYDKERKAYLKSYDSYMSELSGSRLLTATKNKPLERALVDGVDRSRVAKEFIESMMELERAFEEKMAAERQRLLESGKDEIATAGHSAMLEEMAHRFYADMRQRHGEFLRKQRQGRGGAFRGYGAPADVTKPVRSPNFLPDANVAATIAT